ncbi:hypothetical protein ABKN59_007782 [Abortiporus biennis]
MRLILLPLRIPSYSESCQHTPVGASAIYSSPFRYCHSPRDLKSFGVFITFLSDTSLLLRNLRQLFFQSEFLALTYSKYYSSVCTRIVLSSSHRGPVGHMGACQTFFQYSSLLYRMRLGFVLSNQQSSDCRFLLSYETARPNHISGELDNC